MHHLPEVSHRGINWPLCSDDQILFSALSKNTLYPIGIDISLNWLGSSSSQHDRRLLKRMYIDVNIMALKLRKHRLSREEAVNGVKLAADFTRA